MTISQKDGVFNAVVAFCEENSIPFEEGNKVDFDKSQRATIIGMLVAATEAGEMEVKSETARADLKNYWNGTLSNWLRKDTRLNGGEKYVTKNPGSRAGAGDAELKELKKLLSKVTLSGNEENIAAVTQAIEARKAAIAAEKSVEVEINTEVLPESLRHLVS